MDSQISVAATMAIPSGTVEQTALGRYRLRGAINRLAMDCESLVAELRRPNHRAWRVHAGRALAEARFLQTILSHRDGPGQIIDNADLDRMRALMRDSLDDIAEAFSLLLSFIPSDLDEELIMQDVRAAREAVLALIAGNPLPTPSSGTLQAAAYRPSSAELPAPTSAARVLVVDDDDLMRDQLTMLLQRLGHVVTAAENGETALERAQQDPIDLVITDLSMPGMDGFELLGKLKADKRTQHIPIIVVSGESDAESVVRSLEQGAEDHLTKPYEGVVLQARIRTSLERKRLRDLELAYLHRVAQLTAAAEAVESQTYESRLLADVMNRGDQLGQLGRVFDRMVRNMRSREAQLEARVRALRGEIARTADERAQHAPASEANLSDNEVLAGRYEIRRSLGAGGMGAVFLAYDRELGEDVALKVLYPALLRENPQMLERMRTEIKLARKISHPNVVRSHDIGEWEGKHFITMELIKGVTVQHLINTRGKLSVDSTLAIGTQLADALAVAHAQNIIHRDIKPQNLMVDEGGVLKVADFGLARTVQPGTSLTQAGFVVGTLQYMAPEQLLGGTIDGRSDLYAAGVVLFQCLTGRVPFDQTSPMAMLARMVDSAPPSVTDFSNDVPKPLSDIVARLLQREPEHRYASARELGEQLAQFGQGV